MVIIYYILCLYISISNSITIQSYFDPRKDLTGFHTSHEDFLSSTYIVYISPKKEEPSSLISTQKHKEKKLMHEWMETNTSLSQLNDLLKKENCQLISSTTGKHDLLFKIYCKEDVLQAILKDFLEQEFQHHIIQIERNHVYRKPPIRSQFYYGTKEMIDYAIELDYGMKGRDGKSNIGIGWEYDSFFLGKKISKKKNATETIPFPFFNKANIEYIRKNSMTESPAPWALDRIDQQSGSLNNAYMYLNTAPDINFYVVDSGCLTTHQEFQGRATFLVDGTGTGETDGNGHGTFVLSELIGATYGVAKQGNGFCAKALDSNGDGDLSSITTCVMAVIEHSQTNTSRRGVVNLSLGGPYSSTLNNMILTLSQNNLFVSISAGNSDADACNYSPSSLGGVSGSNVMVVGCSDMTDFRCSFSNFGSCTNIYAPGEDVVGAYIGSNIATTTLSGTSMSSPLVGGVAGLVLQQDLSLTVAQVNQLILEWSTQNIIQYTQSGPSNLLFSLIIDNQSPPTPPPTTRSPTRFPQPPDFLLGTSQTIRFNLFITLLSLCFVLYLY